MSATLFGRALASSVVAICVAALPAQQFADLAHYRFPFTAIDWRWSSVAGDIDGDGDVDWLLGSSAGDITVYRNDGRGGFTTAVVLVASAIPAQLAFGDVDADGDLDLLVGNQPLLSIVGGKFFPQTQLFLNDGRGNFSEVTQARMPADQEATTALDLGDVDGDGDLDLVLGAEPWSWRRPYISNPGQNRLYLNDGRGTFTDVTDVRWPADYGVPVCGALGDVDGDGDLDLLHGLDRTNTGDDPDLRLYLNDGSGRFVEDRTGRVPHPSNYQGRVEKLVFADLDGDGDLDVAALSHEYVLAPTLKYVGNKLLLNDGSGRFADVSRQQLPALGLDFDMWRNDLNVGDFDGDGDLDLLFAGIPRTELLLNDGSARFTLAPNGRFPTVWPRVGQAGIFKHALGDLPSSLAGLQQMDVADLDGDLDLDVVIVAGTQGKLYVNRGDGAFVDPTHTALQGASDLGAMAVGDVDGDDLPDVVLGARTEGDGHARLLLNDGRGGFRDRSDTHLPKLPDPNQPGHNMIGPAQWVRMGDLDGDGERDLLLRIFFADNQLGVETVRLWLNDGSGRFVDAGNRLVLPKTTLGVPTDLQLADVDGDGDLDAAFATTEIFGSGGRPLLFLNDGQGNFTDVTATQMPVLSLHSRGMTFGDVDGDNDLDLAIAIVDAPNVLLLNNGAGVFIDASSNLPNRSEPSLSVGFGDVDGDGDQDLIVGNESAAAVVARLLLNDGSGRFTDAPVGLPVVSGSITALAVGDVDLDGDADLALGVGRANLLTAPGALQNVLLLNDGTGLFSTPAPGAGFEHHDDSPWTMALADMDEDGDPDLVLGNLDDVGSWAASSKVLWNLHRHLDAPLLAQIGAEFAIDTYSTPGYAPSPASSVLHLALAPARIPLPPFGVLGLDPSTMVGLPARAIAQPPGKATLRFPIPNQRALLGTRLYAQSWVFGAFDIGLTNTIEVEVIR